MMALREAAKKAGMDAIEATVSGLLEDANRVIGIHAAQKRPAAFCKDSLEELPATDVTSDSEIESFFVDLVFIADGRFSNFRAAVLGDKMKSQTNTVLENVTLPIPEHGTIALVHRSNWSKGHPNAC